MLKASKIRIAPEREKAFFKKACDKKSILKI